MRIGDIYKHKKYNTFIKIEGFAHHINLKHSKNFIIVYSILEEIDGFLGSCPSFMGYALAQSQIEAKYELYIKSEDMTSKNINEVSEKILKEILQD